MDQSSTVDQRCDAKTLLADVERVRREVICSRQPNIIIVNNDPKLWPVIGYLSDSIFAYPPVLSDGAPSPRVCCASISEQSGFIKTASVHGWWNSPRDFDAEVAEQLLRGKPIHTLYAAQTLQEDMVRRNNRNYYLPWFPSLSAVDRVHAAIFIVNTLSDKLIDSKLVASTQKALHCLGEHGVKPYIFYPHLGIVPDQSDSYENMDKATKAAGGALYAFQGTNVAAFRDGLTVVTLCATGLPFIIKEMPKSSELQTSDGTFFAQRASRCYRDMDLHL